VGDAVMTVPALRELRRVLPSSRITLSTRPWAEGVFSGADFIDEVVPSGVDGRGARGLLREAARLRERRFDLAVIFPNAFSHALLARVARVPLRVGHGTDRRSPLLTHALAAPRWRSERHEVITT
jgi:heptosyltransferase-2